MTDTLLLLRLEHLNMGKLLTLVERECERMVTEGDPDHELLQLTMEYFLGFPDRCHHPKEDLIYRALHRRDRQAAEAVGRLLEDHDALAKRVRSVAGLTEKASRLGSRVPLEQLASALRGFVELYRSHLGAEEKGFFPAALSTLTDDDWAAIDFGTFDHHDPLFDDVVEGGFRELRKRIALAMDRTNG